MTLFFDNLHLIAFYADDDTVCRVASGKVIDFCKDSAKLGNCISDFLTSKALTQISLRILSPQ